MLQNPDCPVCSAQSWETLCRKTYRASDIPELSPYLKRKYELLFGAWFVDTKVAEITTVLCRKCGFVMFTPRPTEDELERKYAMAMEMGPHDRVKRPDDAEEQARADELYALVRSYLADGHCRILDVGGADGRLMLPFVRGGYQCFVVDFVTEPVPGVSRIGSTVRDLQSGEYFDFAILSHVLEHVGDPLEMLKHLRAHQPTGGGLFIEVPLELWRSPPPRVEPVTHINFFTPYSLAHLMKRSGYTVRRCRIAARRHGCAGDALVVRAWAGASDVNGATDVVDRNANRFTKRLLEPDLLMNLHLSLIQPRRSFQRIARRIGMGKPS